MTLDTPFGESSTLIQVETRTPHPDLGTGLLCSLILPFIRDAPSLLEECAYLNCFEALTWTGFPQFGTWAPRSHEGDQYSGLAFFVPNVCFKHGLATCAGLWQIARARWVKKQFYAGLQDRPLLEVVKERYRRRGIEVPD